MGRKNQRKFIDKKRDILHTFKIVHRSQQDPLAADEKAPQGVLVDTNCSDSHKEELQKYGVYFDDDYDYLQHLRGVQEAVDWERNDVEVYTIRNEDPRRNEKTKKNVGLILPSSAFESYVEEPIGLLNKAAPVTGPRPELDPDIVADMERLEEMEEGDCDDEEGMPDDFINILNSETPVEDSSDRNRFDNIEQWLGDTQSCWMSPLAAPVEGNCNEQRSMNDFNDMRFRDTEYCSEDGSDVDSCSDRLFVSDEEKEDDLPLPKTTFKRGPRTSATSMTSASAATVPRTELLSILDERFERLYNEEYNDDQIGALDGETIEGPFDVDSEVFQQALMATKKQLQRMSGQHDANEERDRTLHWVKENMKYRNDMQGEKQQMVSFKEKPKPMFDCESILSTYSTTSNRPHLIDDSELFGRRKPKLTKKAVRQHNMADGEESIESDPETMTLLSCISAISLRPKNETPEERRERKGALRELRRERRKEKKSNKLAFKEELKRQKHVQLSKARTKIVNVV